MGLDISYGAAAIAGLLSFVSPCILPVVPFYLCYMAGLSIHELDDTDGISPGAQRRLILSAILFSAGVVTIFVMLGLAATSIGQALREYNTVVTWVAGVVLALFGLHFLGWLRIPLLYREARVDSTKVKPASYVGSYLIGLAFGFGWTPCVGPALTLILYMASQQSSVWQGGSLLLVYGAAMTLPFVLAATFSGPFLRWMQRNRKYLGKVEKIMGAFLILFAILIVSGGIAWFSNFIYTTFPQLFRFG